MAKEEDMSQVVLKAQKEAASSPEEHKKAEDARVERLALLHRQFISEEFTRNEKERRALAVAAAKDAGLDGLDGSKTGEDAVRAKHLPLLLEAEGAKAKTIGTSVATKAQHLWDPAYDDFPIVPTARGVLWLLRDMRMQREFQRRVLGEKSVEPENPFFSVLESQHSGDKAGTGPDQEKREVDLFDAGASDHSQMAFNKAGMEARKAANARGKRLRTIIPFGKSFWTGIQHVYFTEGDQILNGWDERKLVKPAVQAYWEGRAVRAREQLRSAGGRSEAGKSGESRKSQKHTHRLTLPFRRELELSTSMLRDPVTTLNRKYSIFELADVMGEMQLGGSRAMKKADSKAEEDRKAASGTGAASVQLLAGVLTPVNSNPFTGSGSESEGDTPRTSTFRDHADFLSANPNAFLVPHRIEQRYMGSKAFCALVGPGLVSLHGRPFDVCNADYCNMYRGVQRYALNATATIGMGESGEEFDWG